MRDVLAYLTAYAERYGVPVLALDDLDEWVWAS